MPDNEAEAADVAEQDGGETPQNNDQAPSTEEQDQSPKSFEDWAKVMAESTTGRARKGDPLTDEGDEGNDPFAEFVPSDPLADDENEDEVTAETEETDEQSSEESEETETESEPAEEETSEETNEDEQAEEPTEKKPDGRKRLNIYRRNADGSYVYSEEERAELVLADAEGISLSEARRRLGRETAPEPKAEKQEEQAPEESVEDLRAKIEVLKAEKKKAAATLELETALEKADEIHELQRKIESIERAREQSQVAKQTELQTLVNASMEVAIAAYPDIAKEGTPLYEAGQREIARLQKVNPTAFNDPEWPETVAAKVALKLGIAKVAPSEPEARKPAPAPKPKPTQPARKARPLPGPGEGATSAAKPTRGPEQIRADIAAAKANNDFDAIARLTREELMAG